jgi:hypothetical protein
MVQRIDVTTGDVYAVLFESHQPSNLTYCYQFAVKVNNIKYRVTFIDELGATESTEVTIGAGSSIMSQALGGVPFDYTLYVGADLSSFSNIKGIVVEVKSDVPGSPALLQGSLTDKFIFRDE